MSRPLRIEYPGAWYHVMNRGRRREQIFSISRDYELFLQTLRDACEIFNLKVAAYCLMSNHYHLLLHTPDGNLSRCMRHINGVYTQRFNRSHQEEGQLFRGRYKAIVVDSDSYLLEVLRYIHNNPIRGGIVKDVGEYSWSSHSAYASSAKKWNWLSRDFLLAMFSGNNRQARKAYVEFMRKPNPEEIESFYGKKNIASVLGGEAFKEWIREKFRHLRFKQEIPESRLLGLNSMAIKEAVCAICGVDEETLMRSRRGTENAARDLAVFLQRKHCGQTLPEVGKDYGFDNYSSVSSSVERVKERLLRDRKAKQLFEKIEKKLNKSQKRT